MMGTPMAQCLARAGYELWVADLDGARVAALIESVGDGTAQPLTAAAAGSLDALITMLPNSAIVEDTVLGTEGWARHLRAGAVVLDMSTSEPTRSRQLGATLTGRGLYYLDAPVSGGVARARAGTLAVLVGGEAPVLERCRVLLEAMGSVLHVGAAGTGHAAKALNNYVSATGLVATVEALQVGARFGIDPAVMTAVLNASTGRTNTSENKVRQFMLSGTYASGFTMRLMNKDLEIAQSLARSVDYPMQLGAACVALWSEAAKRVPAGADHTEMYRLLADEEP